VPWVATLNDEERAFVEMKATEVREDQFIAALDHRNEARRIAEDRSGETAANERLEQLMDEKDEVCKRVSITRARTLSGVLAKLALIASDFDDESASELPGRDGNVRANTVQHRSGLQGVECAHMNNPQTKSDLRKTFEDWPPA
jgi:hypothetical protein